MTASVSAKEQFEESRIASGEVAGKRWARERAKPKQLESLSGAGELFLGIPDAFGWAGVLYVAMHRNRFNDRTELNSFWEGILGKAESQMIDDEDFARGFVAGALVVWAEVRDKR